MSGRTPPQSRLVCANNRSDLETLESSAPPDRQLLSTALPAANAPLVKRKRESNYISINISVNHFHLTGVKNQLTGTCWLHTDGMAWLGLAWLGLAWLGLDWIGLDWIGLDWIGLDWIGLDGWNGMEWIGMEWNGMGRDGMEWNGMDGWMGGMDWMGSVSVHVSSGTLYNINKVWTVLFLLTNFNKIK